MELVAAAGVRRRCGGGGDGAGHDLAHRTLVDIKWHQEELDAEVEAAHRAGLQLMMHVQSASAVDMALLALERALTRHPRADHRHRLETPGICRWTSSGWACHLDDRGVLTPGKLADLVVLGTNPWQVPVDALPDVTVDQVWIGGEPRH